MKTMSCIDCDEGEFKANTAQEMMGTMMPHYKEAHAEMMASQTSESHEDWMKRFNEKWEETKEE